MLPGGVFGDEISQREQHGLSYSRQTHCELVVCFLFDPVPESESEYSGKLYYSGKFSLFRLFLKVIEQSESEKYKLQVFRCKTHSKLDQSAAAGTLVE